jgi:hypothetical protein
MGSIEQALKFYVAEWHGSPLILVPSLGGIPEVAVPSYPLLRVSYLSPEEAATEQGLARAKTKLQGGHPLLFLTTPSPDGPPSRSGVIFRYEQSVRVHWTDGRNGKPEIEADEYLAVVTLSRYSWGSDLQRGRPGCFLSGPSNGDNLWRVARVEADFAGRQLFTLSPVRLASGLPDADFSAIDNDLLRQKLERDWDEAQRCLANNLYSSMITAAKNVVESLVVFAVGNPSRKLTLEQGLVELRKTLDARQPCRLPFTFLDYHLMSKLRILHGHTHSDRVEISGRLVDPGFALTVLADLVEVLKSVGLSRPK